MSGLGQDSTVSLRLLHAEPTARRKAACQTPTGFVSAQAAVGQLDSSATQERFQQGPALR